MNSLQPDYTESLDLRQYTTRDGQDDWPFYSNDQVRQDWAKPPELSEDGSQPGFIPLCYVFRAVFLKHREIEGRETVTQDSLQQAVVARDIFTPLESAQ